MPTFLQPVNNRLGRHWGSGLIHGVRPLSIFNVPGHKEVDQNAEFLPGMVAMMGVDSNNKPVIQAHDGTAAKGVVGVILNSKTNSFYSPIVREEITWPAAVPGDINLSKPYITDFMLENVSDGSVPVGSPENYSLNATNGVLTAKVDGDGLGTNAPAVDTAAYVTYRYKDLDTVGFDQTIASGKVAILEGPGDIALLVYDTTVQYAINMPIGLKDASNALFTGDATASNLTHHMGFVIKPPTAEDNSLHVKLV